MIVIPMAGLSSRFFKEGYALPKYMLTAHGMSIFEHAVKSFERYFENETFLFIVRNLYDTESFVIKKAQKLGIKSFHIKVLEKETSGQAATVFAGINEIEDTTSAITIFNIDTFRPNFAFPQNLTTSEHSYLEVFQGNGDNWSFVLPKSPNSTEVIETAEKRAISDLCCTGLYHFSSINDFLDAYQYFVQRKHLWEKGELYVAPLYNYLIQKNKPVHYHLIKKNEVIFCGVPAEYEAFKNDSI